MPDRRCGRAAVRAAWLVLLAAPAAFAYGPEGHLIAGRAAEPLLCPRAAREVARLAGGEDLGEIGLWADRIRANPDYADAAPWHYVNVADGASLRELEHPAEGDVLWAIGHFAERLGDARLDDAARAEALRFLTHFIVDLHQPLHVGLEADRGGNDIPLVFRGQRTNLHRLWDTQAIEWTGQSVSGYTAEVRRLAAAIPGPVSSDPLVWARESLDLRPAVYDFGRSGSEPPKAYLDLSARVTRERLALASLRLAATLNGILCH